MPYPLGSDSLARVWGSGCCASFVAMMQASNHVPALLEIIYPFELADELVLSSITSSVMHCREHYCGERLLKAHIA